MLDHECKPVAILSAEEAIIKGVRYCTTSHELNLKTQASAFTVLSKDVARPDRKVYGRFTCFYQVKFQSTSVFVGKAQLFDIAQSYPAWSLDSVDLTNPLLGLHNKYVLLSYVMGPVLFAPFQEQPQNRKLIIDLTLHQSSDWDDPTYPPFDWYLGTNRMFPISSMHYIFHYFVFIVYAHVCRDHTHLICPNSSTQFCRKIVGHNNNSPGFLRGFWSHHSWALISLWLAWSNQLMWSLYNNYSTSGCFGQFTAFHISLFFPQLVQIFK